MTLRLILTSMSLPLAIMVGCMQTEESGMFFSFNQKRLLDAKDSGFYLHGHMADNRFVADSGVLGDGEFGTSGQRGWLELPDGVFYPMHTARSPRSPYVRGYMTQSGFKPESREVR